MLLVLVGTDQPAWVPLMWLSTRSMTLVAIPLTHPGRSGAPQVMDIPLGDRHPLIECSLGFAEAADGLVS